MLFTISRVFSLLGHRSFHLKRMGGRSKCGRARARARATSKEERIRTQALVLFLAFDFELSLDFLHKRET